MNYLICPFKNIIREESMSILFSERETCTARFASCLWFFSPWQSWVYRELGYSVLQFISLSMNRCWISFTLEFFSWLEAFRKYAIFVGNEVILSSSPKWYSLWNIDGLIFFYHAAFKHPEYQDWQISRQYRNSTKVLSIFWLQTMILAFKLLGNEVYLMT